jgi:hypothetical protein
MINLFLLIVIGTLLTWALTDLYFYSVLFDPLRRKITFLAADTKERGFRTYLAYLADCPFCLSHWFAALSVGLIWFDVACLKDIPLPEVTPLTAAILVFIVARLANVLRDHILPPLVNDLSPVYNDNGSNNKTTEPSDSPSADASEYGQETM